MSLTKEIVNERIAERGITLIGDYIGSMTKSLFKCQHGHEWQATPNDVMKCTGCPHCPNKALLTKEIVNERIAERGITLIGDYIGRNNKTKIKTKSLFKCQHGHEWLAKPDKILQGRGCPVCAVTGFKPDQPAKLYFLEINSPILTAPIYKVGITNNTVEQRIAGMFATKGTSITVIEFLQFNKGQEAYDLEQYLHNKYKHLAFQDGKELIGNGFTELFTKNIWELENK